jgi:signal transduction histidine kinase
MLTETGTGLYVDRLRLHGYEGLEEILRSPGSLAPNWPGDRSCPSVASPLRRKNYHQIILDLKDIRPASPWAEIPAEVDVLSILNPPAGADKTAARSWHPDEPAPCGNPCPSLRLLISGVSHAFNDLLMGMEGNLALIRLSIDPRHPCSPVLESMEEMIHSGSFMVNLLFAYLAERRAKSRWMRFRQLIQETCGPDAQADFEPARRRFERWLDAASHQDHLFHVAENSGRIFNSLVLNLGSCLEGLNAELKFNVAAAARIKKVTQLADALMEIAEKLLCYAGSRVLEQAPVSISRLLDARLDAFRRQHRHIEVKTHISRAMLAIRADERLVSEAVDQILRNAAESMPNGGRIGVRAKRLTFHPPCNRHLGAETRRYFMMEIADTGIGMPRETRERIFDPFFTTKPQGRGHGLGLSVADGVLRMHGGFIDVESQPGGGSRFRLYLP